MADPRRKVGSALREALGPSRRGKGRVARQVSQEEMKKALLHSMVAAPIKVLELARRAPEFARKRKWPPDPVVQKKGGTGYEFLGAVVGAYRMGARGQVFTIPEAFLAHERWAALVAQFGRRPTAEVIVEAMEMDELLGEEAQHESPS